MPQVRIPPHRPGYGPVDRGRIRNRQHGVERLVQRDQLPENPRIVFGEKLVAVKIENPALCEFRDKSADALISAGDRRPAPSLYRTVGKNHPQPVRLQRIVAKNLPVRNQQRYPVSFARQLARQLGRAERPRRKLRITRIRNHQYFFRIAHNQRF